LVFIKRFALCLGAKLDAASVDRGGQPGKWAYAESPLIDGMFSFVRPAAPAPRPARRRAVARQRRQWERRFQRPFRIPIEERRPAFALIPFLFYIQIEEKS
jgi:hypothetical protein